MKTAILELFFLGYTGDPELRNGGWIPTSFLERNNLSKTPTALSRQVLLRKAMKSGVLGAEEFLRSVTSELYTDRKFLFLQCFNEELRDFNHWVQNMRIYNSFLRELFFRFRYRVSSFKALKLSESFFAIVEHLDVENSTPELGEQTIKSSERVTDLNRAIENTLLAEFGLKSIQIASLKPKDKRDKRLGFFYVWVLLLEWTDSIQYKDKIFQRHLLGIIGRLFGVRIANNPYSNIYHALKNGKAKELIEEARSYLNEMEAALKKAEMKLLVKRKSDLKK